MTENKEPKENAPPPCHSVSARRVSISVPTAKARRNAGRFYVPVARPAAGNLVRKREFRGQIFAFFDHPTDSLG